MGTTAVLEAMGEVVADRRAVDPCSLSPEELRVYVLETDRVLSQLAGDHARVVAAADALGVWAADGDRSCAGWLARQRRRPRHATGSIVGLGRALRQLPLVAEALVDGRIAVEHARELVRCWRFAPAEFAVWEPQAVEHAEGRTWRDFARLTAHWCAVVDPDGTEDAATKRLEQRHLHTHTRYDGVVSFHGQADAISGEVILRALRAIEDELWQQDWAAAKAVHGDDTLPSHVTRSPAQRRLDALRIMAERSLAMPLGARLPVPSVVVYVDYATLTGALCELSSGVQLTPGEAASVFDEPAIELERIVFGPGNRIIELSKRQRTFTGGLRRAIQLRDRHCQYDGCDVPSERCEVDHVVDYADDGETTQENGRAACDPHNRHKRSDRQPLTGWLRGLGDDDPDPGPGDTVEAAIRARVQSLIDRAA